MNVQGVGFTVGELRVRRKQKICVELQKNPHLVTLCCTLVFTHMPPSLCIERAGMDRVVIHACWILILFFAQVRSCAHDYCDYYNCVQSEEYTEEIIGCSILESNCVWNHVLIYSIIWCSMLPSCLCCTLGMDATSMCRIIVFPIETEFLPKCFLLVPYSRHASVQTSGILLT